MQSIFQKKQRPKPLCVLLIGNNPIELSTILEKLNQVRSPKISTEIAFDLKSIVDRLLRFKPNFILIDDNIGQMEMVSALQALEGNRKTRNVPITLLKSSNYHEALGTHGILDYLLKQNLSSEGIYSMLRNSLKFRRTQQYFFNAYQKRKEQLSKLIKE